MKRYYWLKLKKDFFRDLKMKKLRRKENGELYLIIYLKMMLATLDCECEFDYSCGNFDEFVDSLALDIDENVEDVENTCVFLIENNLLIKRESGKMFLPGAYDSVGSEQDSAKRVRKMRAAKKTLHCNTEKDKELELELETEIETEAEAEISSNSSNGSNSLDYFKQVKSEIAQLTDVNAATKISSDSNYAEQHCNFAALNCGSDYTEQISVHANSAEEKISDGCTRRAGDVDVRKWIIEHFNAAIGGSITEYQYRLYSDLYKNYGAEILEKALHKAAEANAKNYKYVKSAAAGIAAGNDFDEKNEAEMNYSNRDADILNAINVDEG